MKPEAILAIHAARHRPRWGAYATRRNMSNSKVPFALYRLACQLEAAQKVIDLMPPHLKRQALGDYQTLGGRR